MKVKAGSIPGIIADFGVADNATAADVLATANIDYDGGTITINGMPVSPTTVVRENDRVVVTRNAKGN